MTKKEPAPLGQPAVTVDKKEYAEFIGGLLLLDVSVQRSCTNRLARLLDLSRKVDVAVNDKASFSMAEEKVCVIHHAYSLQLCYDGENTPLVTIECEFDVGYRTEKPMTDAYFDIFKRTSLPFSTWPYWREFVHSSFGRMGLPPFILPMVKRG